MEPMGTQPCPCQGRSRGFESFVPLSARTSGPRPIPTSAPLPSEVGAGRARHRARRPALPSFGHRRPNRASMLAFTSLLLQASGATVRPNARREEPDARHAAASSCLRPGLRRQDARRADPGADAGAHACARDAPDEARHAGRRRAVPRVVARVSGCIGSCAVTAIRLARWTVEHVRTPRAPTRGNDSGAFSSTVRP